MKHMLLILSVVIVPCAAAQSDSESVTASVTIQKPSPTCSLSKTDITFGNLERPGSGTLTATIDPDPASSFFTYSGTSSGTQSQGTLTVTGTNLTSWTVTRGTVPDSLTASGCTGQCGVAFDFDWAESTSSSGNFTNLGSTGSHTETGAGEGNSDTHYFRMGGDVDVDVSTKDQTYSNTVAMSLTCS